MENLNAEQVKKCLEVCSKQYKDDACDKCPDCIYHNLGSNCVLQAVTDAYALITSQEQRIKELTEELEKERTWADSLIDNLRDDIREFTEENEKLKVIPKEMVERLKTYFATFVLGYNIPLTDALKAVNQIAKQMLEGEK